MDIQKEIINAIDVMIKKSLEKYRTSQDIASVVQEISGSKYKVLINGNTFWIPCGTNLTLSVGKPVWVHIPNGDTKKAFILAYR